MSWKGFRHNPERTPEPGYFNVTARSADWEIKWLWNMASASSTTVWFRSGPTLAGHDRHGGSAIRHPLHNGLFNATYQNNIKFTLDWENILRATSWEMRVWTTLST